MFQKVLLEINSQLKLPAIIVSSLLQISLYSAEFKGKLNTPASNLIDE